MSARTNSKIEIDRTSLGYYLHNPNTWSTKEMLSKDAVLKLIRKYKTKNPDVEIKLSTGQNMTKEEFEALLAEA